MKEEGSFLYNYLFAGMMVVAVVIMISLLVGLCLCMTSGTLALQFIKDILDNIDSYGEMMKERKDDVFSKKKNKGEPKTTEQDAEEEFRAKFEV